MNAEGTSEIWQIESNGQVIDTDFEKIAELIDRGNLLRIDRVRQGDARWIEAGKVPALISVFNAKDGDEPPKPVITLTKLGPPNVSEPSASAGGKNINPQSTLGAKTDVANSQSSLTPADAGGSDLEPVCSMHADVSAVYICGTCFSHFCKACPASYGGTVKICPYCGAMCEPLAKMESAKTENANYSAAIGNGFGFGDFAQALAYPFKFKTSLFIGAVMFMLFSIGQSAMGFGGIYMMGSALACYLLANTLTFGVLSNTIQNFAQGKIGENFMPSFDEFSMWDDVIHPFFLSIGVWIVSFGPLIILLIATFFFVAVSVSKEMNAVQSDAAQTVVPELPIAVKAAQQSQAVRDLLNKTSDDQKRRVEQMSEPPAVAGGLRQDTPDTDSQQNPLDQPPATAGGSDKPIDESEQAVMRANELIQQTQKAQLESVVGKAPEARAKEQSELITQILGYGIIFLLVGGVCMLWGLFYFPAACAVAGYTQSFAATLNPTVGLDTIKRLGVDYFKILLMALVIVIMSGMVSGVFSVVFSAFDMPGLGNIPAKALGSLFGFYFSVVFSCVLGFAMFKASDRLKLPS